MTTTIYKYPFDVTDDIEIPMPIGAEVLAVQVQVTPRGEMPCIWARVDPSDETEVRHFRLVGTGHEVPEFGDATLNYVGTFQMIGGAFVGHLFEVVPR